MNRTAPRRPISQKRHAVGRRGAVALLTIVLLLTAMALVGVVIELSLLYHVQIQLGAASDATALAGAAELVDEDILYPNRPAQQTDDVNRAREVAIAYGRSNLVAGAPLLCEANTNNAADGDLVVGWIGDPQNHRAALTLSNGEQPCNTLQVVAQRTRARQSGVRLWFTSILGFADTDARAVSRACVDQRVVGFRPTIECNIPLAPIAIRESGSSDSWMTQAFAAPIAGRNDRFRVDTKTGAIGPGADGIPEIVLPLRSAGTSASDEPAAPSGPALLVFSSGAWSSSEAARQFAEGITADDLFSLGGEIALDESSRLVVPGRLEFDTRVLQSVLQSLGAKYIWPLYRSRQTGDDGLSIELIGFAAGRIVDTRREPDGDISLTLQACIFITPTALVGSRGDGHAHNPWIAKLSLTR